MNFFQKKAISSLKKKHLKNSYYLEQNTINKTNNKRRNNSSWQRLIKYYKWRLLRLREDPHAIARGFAVGVFAGCLPLLGLQFLISLLLSFLVRGNNFTALLGTWISNPFTYIPLFLFNFQVGKLILGFSVDNQGLEFDWQSWDNFAEMGTDIAVTLLFGSVVVGFTFSAIAYHLILRLLAHWKKY